MVRTYLFVEELVKAAADRSDSLINRSAQLKILQSAKDKPDNRKPRTPSRPRRDRSFSRPRQPNPKVASDLVPLQQTRPRTRVPGASVLDNQPPPSPNDDLLLTTHFPSTDLSSLAQPNPDVFCARPDVPVEGRLELFSS